MFTLIGNYHIYSVLSFNNMKYDPLSPHYTFIYGYSSSLYTRIVATASMIPTQYSCILCSLKMLLLELKQ